MVFKESINQLRKYIPIGILDAQNLLIEFDGDINISVSKFVERGIQKIIEITGESKMLVSDIFEKQKYHRDKTLSRIRDIQHDRNFDFSRLHGVSERTFDQIHEWFVIEDHEGVSSSILSDFTLEFIDFIRNTLLLDEVATNIEMLRKLGISFSRLGTKGLDDEERYDSLVAKFELNRTKLESEISIVYRNFVRSS